MQPSAQSNLQSNIWKYYLYHFLLDLQLWYPIWVIYLTEERGFSLTKVTLVDVPFWLAVILLQIPAAALADRWGRKPMLIMSAGSLAVAVTLFGLAESFPLLLFSYLIWGVSYSFLYGTESAFIFDSLKAIGREGEYTKIYGRAWGLATAAILGGTLLGAPLAEATSLPVPILVSGGIAALAAVSALTFVEPKRSGRSLGAISYGQIVRESAHILRRSRHVRYGVLFYGLMTVGFVGPWFFLQPFLLDHNVDVGDSGFWQTPTRIAGIVGAIAAHQILISFGEKRVFFAMPVAVICSFLLLGFWDSIYAVAAFPVLFFVVQLSQPAITDYLNRRVPSEQRATVLSLTNLIRSMVIMPVAPIFGLLADEFSLTTMFLASGLVMIGPAIVLMVLWSPLLSVPPSGEGAESDPAGASGDEP